jgi:hypothetical protein
LWDKSILLNPGPVTLLGNDRHHYRVAIVQPDRRAVLTRGITCDENHVHAPYGLRADTGCGGNHRGARQQGAAAQREVLPDQYPVHLISGSDLILMLKYLRLRSDGRLNEEWIAAIKG